MFTAYKKMLTNWRDFNGRTSRKDYWLAVLANIIIAAIIGAIVGIVTVIAAAINEDFGAVIGIIAGIIPSIYNLIVLIPGISMAIRRLHDTGRSGMVYLWCILGNLCCGIGGIVLLVFECMASDPNPNQWGPNPNFAGNMNMGYNQPMYNQNMGAGQYGQPNMPYGQQNGQYGQQNNFNNQGF